MITLINEFKLYENKKQKTIGYDLIIVDVLDEFDEYFSDEYIKELNKYTEKFSRVFQICDNTKSKKYIFKNQISVFNKEYNNTLDINDVDYYFLPQYRNDIRNKLINIPDEGEIFKTIHNDYWLYLGKEKWFFCNNQLINFFERLKKQQRSVIIVGKDIDDKIDDIYYIMTQIGVNVKYNKKYNYTKNGSIFDKIEESLLNTNITFQMFTRDEIYEYINKSGKYDKGC